MRNLITEGEALLDAGHERDEEDKYVFTGRQGEKDMLGLTVELQNDSSKKVLIVTEAHEMIAFVCQLIGEEMEKFREYNNLSGLLATDLMLKGSRKAIPMQGKIGDYVKDNDELLCRIVSDDLWLHIKFDMRCGFETKNVVMELRVNKDYRIGYMRLVIEKIALNLWSHAYASDAQFFYILRSICIRAIKNFKTSLRSSHREPPSNIIDHQMDSEKVGEHFGIDSMLEVQVEIATLEDELQTNPYYAIDKFDGRNVENKISSQVTRENFRYPSHLGLKKRFSPKTSNDTTNSLYQLFVVSVKTPEMLPWHFTIEEDSIPISLFDSFLLVDSEESQPESHRGSKSIVEQKQINLSSFLLRSSGEDSTKSRHSFEKNLDQRIVAYNAAINFIQVKPDFMSLEELNAVKPFPMREYQIIKAPRLSIDATQSMPERNWKRNIILILAGLGVLLVVIIMLVIIYSQFYFVKFNPSGLIIPKIFQSKKRE